jgi:hypothetical protein
MVIRDTKTRRLLAYTIRAAGVHLLIAALSPLVSFLLTISAQHLFGNPMEAHPFSDVRLYFVYANQAMAGNIPYRDFLVEYPPFSFPLLLLPRLFARSLLNYAIAFIVEMVLINAVAVYLIARTVESREGIERVPERLVWYTLFVFALGPIVFAKFDLAPMVLALAAVLAWFSGRSCTGGILAGLGTLVKVFPAVIVGPALVFEAARSRVWRWRGALAFVVTVGTGVALWLGLGVAGVRTSLGYHLERGLEVESLYSGLLMIVAKVAGAPMSWVFDHGSFQLLTSWSAAVATLALPLQAATLLLVIWRFYRSGMRDGIRFCGAAVVAFVITGKVLSPQYLIWLFPFMTLLEGSIWRRARLVFLVCCLASTAIYPWAFGELLSFTPLTIGILNLRNLLLVFLLILLLFSTGRSRAVDPSTAARRSATSETGSH